jgi:UDP-N-acetylglucosamine kinase
MAGSPGAGKTEASLELLESLGDSLTLRIDPDELRHKFPSYTGANAWLLQGAVSILVEKIHDMALSQGQSFLLDGTLSHYGIAHKNIERSLKKNRTVQILYVYQEPRMAWAFVRAREAAEGRRIQPETFIEQYFAARDVVNRLKATFGKDIAVDLLLKNNDNTRRLYEAGIERIDNHIPEKYTRADLEQMIKLG